MEPKDFRYTHRPDHHKWVIGKAFIDDHPTPTAQHKHGWPNSRMDTRTDECSICGVKRIMQRKIDSNGNQIFKPVLYQNGMQDIVPELMPLCKTDAAYKIVPKKI